MGRIVLYDTGYQTVSAVQDLLELGLASTQTAVIHCAKVMQSSDEASSEAEQLQVNLKRATGAYTSGSGGGTATEIKYSSSNQTAPGLGVKERNNTTQAVAGSGALEVLWPGVFNILAGEWEITFVPELRPVIGPSEVVILSVDESPADSLTLRAIILLEILAG